MWQAPNQRAGGAQGSKKKRDRMGIPMHIHRVRLDIRIIPNAATAVQVENKDQEGNYEPIEGRALLNDFSIGGIGLSTCSALQVGQDVRLNLVDPANLVIHGKVMWVQEQRYGSPILSAQAFVYRAGVKFVFKTPEEEQAVKKFCDDLRAANMLQATE